jgi:hypothetical protein
MLCKVETGKPRFGKGGWFVNALSRLVWSVRMKEKTQGLHKSVVEAPYYGSSTPDLWIAVWISLLQRPDCIQIFCRCGMRLCTSHKLKSTAFIQIFCRCVSRLHSLTGARNTDIRPPRVVLYLSAFGAV